MKKILILLSITIVFGEKFNPELMNLGKRDNHYRVWIYFHDKIGSEMSPISQRAKDRRAKSDVQSNHLWYDLEVSQIYINDLFNLLMYTFIYVLVSRGFSIFDDIRYSTFDFLGKTVLKSEKQCFFAYQGAVLTMGC